MRTLTPVAVVALAIAGVFFMVMAATQTDAARSPASGHVHIAVPWGMSAPDLPE